MPQTNLRTDHGRAGRKTGSVSKVKVGLLARLKREFPGYHPIVEMARIAHNAENDVALRAQMHTQIAKYVTPQLKSVEHKGLGPGATNIQIIITPHSDVDHHG